MGLAAQMHRLRRPEALGASITIPYKESAARHTDGLNQTARFVGAINTVVNRDGMLEGYNTDVTGFQRSLQQAGFDPAGANVVIWGAGGVARAVAWALIWRQAARLTIVNRTLTRAGRLQQDISNAAADVQLRSCGIDEAAATDALAACDLVVQCTPVGLRGSETENDLPFALEALRAGTMVVDLIAQPHGVGAGACGQDERSSRAGRIADACVPRRGGVRALDTTRSACGGYVPRGGSGDGGGCLDMNEGVAITFAVIFVFVSGIGLVLFKEMRTHRVWRGRVEANDLGIIRGLLDAEIDHWRSMRPPKDVSAAVWAGVQGNGTDRRRRDAGACDDDRRGGVPHRRWRADADRHRPRYRPGDRDTGWWR